MSALNISSYNLCVLFIRKDTILNHIPENKEQLLLLWWKPFPRLVLLWRAFPDIQGVYPEARGLLPSLALSMSVSLSEMRTWGPQAATRLHCVHGRAPPRLIAESAAVSLPGILTSKYISTALSDKQCHRAVVTCWLAQRGLKQARLPPRWRSLGPHPTQTLNLSSSWFLPCQKDDEDTHQQTVSWQLYKGLE